MVWAKVMGYKYAPAKLMQIGESSVTVHFFEDHAFASIPLQFCKGFSEKCPNQNFKLTAKAGQVKMFFSCIRIRVSFNLKYLLTGSARVQKESGAIIYMHNVWRESGFADRK